MLVPLGVQGLLTRLSGVGLTRIIDTDADKGVRESEQIPLGKIPGTQHCHTDFNSIASAAHNVIFSLYPTKLELDLQ